MAHSFQIGEFILVPSLNQLHCANQVYTLEPKVIDLLFFFTRQPNIIASREDIRSAIWGNITVSDHAINRLISQSRKALNDNKQPYKYIETVAKRGYRLVAKVSSLQDEVLTESVNPNKITQRVLLLAIIATIIVSTLYTFKSGLIAKETSLKINGGTINQISSMPGREWKPKYSSKGQLLTYLHFDKAAKKYHIMLKADQQKSAIIAFSTDKRISDYYWLPNQDRLMVATFDGQSCSIEQLELSKQYNQLVKTPFLVPCGSSPARAITWSQSDNKLYWIASRGELFRQKINAQKQPFTYLKTAIVEKVSAVEDIYEFSLSLSGRYLAILKHNNWERSDIDVYDIATNTQKTLLKSDLLIQAISWDSTNDNLIYVEDNEVNTLSIDGTVTNAGFNSESDLYNIYFSAEKYILLYATSNTKYQLVHLTKEADSTYSRSTPQWSSQVNERNPVYSHDGESIAFISQRDGQYGISIKEGNHTVRQLKLNELDLSQTLIRWSPNDQKLLFHSKKSLFIYYLKTDEYKQITDYNIYADVAGWSYREPGSVYFRSDFKGQMNIWLISIHSGEIKQITKDGGYSVNESQDGKYLYYSKEFEAGLWRIDLRTNKEILLINDFSKENYLSWYLTTQGIYYLYSNKQIPSIYYYSFNNQSEKIVWPYEPWLHGGFTISADQQNIYLGLKEQIEWNIMSVNTK
jgi:DNA-binding winged helix-turn-helix (wHTH) protein/Tol biopolymer transport system component